MTDVARIDEARRQIEIASTIEELHEGYAKLSAIETYMRNTGLYPLEDIQNMAEAKALAVWKMGLLLADSGKNTSSGVAARHAGTSEYRELLDGIDLNDRTARKYQSISTLPEKQREEVFARARKDGRAVTLAELEFAARPYAAKDQRQQKHAAIKAAAANPNIAGTYPLIYADPPWEFITHSWRGQGRSPEKHYPTMTDDEIMAFEIDGNLVTEIAHKDAVLFLWCTSSNIFRAGAVLEAWGFTFKTNAVWVKDRSGTGYNFLNQHEHILMGTRGNMPAPVVPPPSVFNSPRGKHSVKPGIVRETIERMYPHFDKTTRLEMFCRDPHPGWTVTGYEANGNGVDRNDSITRGAA